MLRDTGSLVTPASNGALFWATTAGLSQWKIWLFVHFVPPWQEAQLSANTCCPRTNAPVALGVGCFSGRTAAKIHRVWTSSVSLAYQTLLLGKLSPPVPVCLWPINL
jgi:hypothetical protein